MATHRQRIGLIALWGLGQAAAQIIFIMTFCSDVDSSRGDRALRCWLVIVSAVVSELMCKDRPSLHRSQAQGEVLRYSIR